MSSRMTIALGAALLVIGLAGFGYLLARPRPALVAAPSEALPLEEPSPSPTPESTPKIETPKIQVPHRLALPARYSIPQLAVELLRPGMADTFTAPAKVTLSAVAYPAKRVKQVTFYHQRIGVSGQSMCRSLTKLPELVAALTDTNQIAKLSEVATAPYEFNWTADEPGIYRVMAVATYDSGLQQMSASGVVVINAPDTYDGKDWIGWRPAYPAYQIAEQDPELMPPPGPAPSCPAITVESLSAKVPAGSMVTFRAAAKRGEPGDGLRYDWTVIGGEIVGGKGTPIITVAVTGVQKEITASVEIGGLDTVCANTASFSVPIIQPRWLNDTARDFLLQRGRILRRFAAELKTDQQARGYIVASGESDLCVDRDTISEADFMKKYLVDLHHVEPTRIVMVNGSQPNEGDETESRDWALEIVPPGAEPSDAVQKAKPLIACKRGEIAARPAVNNFMKAPINRKCPDIDENIRFVTSLPGEPGEPLEMNICPYNPGDPASSLTQLDLGGNVTMGNYGNFPSFRFWSNAGKIVGNGQAAIWDLSEVKLHPGIYTAVTVADDGCDCASVNAVQVKLTNFCTPCLHLRKVCSAWVPDNSEVFVATTENFATTDTNSYRWTTTKGKITNGQNSSQVTIDTSSLPKGTEYTVTVSVSGLQRYCVNRLSFKAVVGGPCEVVRKVDPYGRFDGETRRAKRRPPQANQQQGEEVPEVGDSDVPAEGPPTLPGEKEWIKVAWSPKVRTDDSFAIVVTYDRTTEKVEVSNQAGDTTEALNLAGAFKVLKDKYGPDFRTMANVRFDSAGLDVSFCKEQYQSLDNPKVEWSCSVSPKRAGTQTFNLELWAKGEPRKRSEAARNEAEKVWSKNNLKVEVSAPILTKTTVFASASLCVVLGLGFSLRWLRIYHTGDTYNVGQAVAVGRNVHLENTTVTQTRDAMSTNQGEKEKKDG